MTARMRRRARLRWVVVAVLVGVSSISVGPSMGWAISGDEPPLWVVLGDPLSAATADGDTESSAWPDRLAARMGVRVRVVGEPGATTDDLMPRVRAEVLALHPQRVILMVGVHEQTIPNGAPPDAYRVPPERFADQVAQILRALEEASIPTMVVTARPLVEGPGGPEHNYFLDRHGDGGALYSMPGRTKRTIFLYNQILTRLAAQRGARMVDLWQAMVYRAGNADHDDPLLATEIGQHTRNGMPSDDGVHLGPLGDRVLTDLIAAGLPTNTPPVPPHPDPRNARPWVAFGDSLTNMGGRAGMMWPELLAERLDRPIIGAGRHGGFTSRALARLDRDVLAHRPARVFIMFGINDQDMVAEGTHRVPPTTFTANLDQIITRIRAANAQPVLLTNRPLIEGPTGSSPGLYLDRHAEGGAWYPQPGRAKVAIRHYNQLIAQAAERHQIPLIDLWQAVVDVAGSDADADLLRARLGFPGTQEDGVHFGARGTRLVVQTILAALPTLPTPLGEAAVPAEE